jgi:Zn-dependent protease with chaperone function
VDAGCAGALADPPLLEVPLAEVKPDAQVGSARRFLGLPGGAQLQTDDHDAVAALFPPAMVQRGVRGLERLWGAAFAAILVIAAFAWWCVAYGLPVAARLVAMAVPATLEAKLGDQTLYSIDRTFCEPSVLDADRRAPALKQFERLTAGLHDDFLYRLEFRSCPRIGANAFALPGGAVVLTDDMLQLANDDGELAAVLAHELGHVQHRHGLRLGLQGAGLVALVAALAGDAVSITGLGVALPTALLQAGYSRAFEEEADDYAIVRLRDLGIPLAHFRSILQSIATEREEATRGSAFDYLSTHPSTRHRLERAFKGS